MPAYEHHSDEQLSQAALHDDLDAWATLIQRHGQRLLAYLTRMSGDQALAKELWVQTWAELWALRRDQAGAGGLVNAAFTLGTRFAVKAAQPAAPEPKRHADPASLGARADRLGQALLGIPARPRAALCLCYMDNLTYADAGRALGSNQAEARQLCAEGYALLAQALGPHFLQEGLA